MGGQIYMGRMVVGFNDEDVEIAYRMKLPVAKSVSPGIPANQ